MRILMRLSRHIGGVAAGAILTAGLSSGPVEAGGYDVGQRYWDFLFQQKMLAAAAEMRRVEPTRELTNIRNTLLPGTQARNPETEGFWITSFSAAARLGEHFRCMASFRQPWEGHANYGRSWVGAAAVVEQHFSSEDYGLTCSAALPVGPGFFHLIGGGSLQRAHYTLSQNVLAPTLLVTDVDDESTSWRVGVAYEIPDYALRVSLIYDSEVRYDMTGAVTVAGASTPAFGSITMPQALELRAQSGIAPGWLAFGSIRWTNWSVADNMPICAVGTPVCTQAAAISGLALYWKDSWTVTVGAAHQFNDKATLTGSLTWDQGASKGFTSNTDTWIASSNLVLTPNDNVILKLNGAAGIMTGGSLSTATLAGGIPNPVGYTASFGNDLVYSLSGSFTLKF